MILLEHHKQAKREIIARFQQLADVAEGVGMITLARDIRNTRIPKLEAERFHLVVLGEFNHGKSTFVNALLGADILPAGITPTTAAINHVVWAPSPTARVVLVTGENRLLDPSQLKEWVTVAGGRAAEVSYVELGYPSDLPPVFVPYKRQREGRLLIKAAGAAEPLIPAVMAVLRKEAIHMRRDKGTLRLALMIPVFQLVLFGSIDTNVRDVPTAVFDQCRCPDSRQLLDEMTATRTFRITRYVASLPVAKSEKLVKDGDAKAGAGSYATCIACHGAKGEGNAATKGPPLAQMQDWYMLAQLKKFKAGVRGANPNDTTGSTMRAMSAIMIDEQMMKNVIAHIGTLNNP